MVQEAQPLSSWKLKWNGAYPHKLVAVLGEDTINFLISYVS